MKISNPSTKRAVIRPSSLKELANMYGMDRKTMSRWLKPHYARIGERIGRYYNVRQMEAIFDALGFPPAFDDV
ncbi:MAG: hypothetical protein GXC78_05530 [Chitinophagaceae bacterium]|jgi:hypothetical protein|nr:hypothetical protein [Chitinophagaceae bacterium]